MYFFKHQKLKRLYNKQRKLKNKLAHCIDKADKTVLEAKLSDVNLEIQQVEYEIKYKN